MSLGWCGGGGWHRRVGGGEVGGSDRGGEVVPVTRLGVEGREGGDEFTSGLVGEEEGWWRN